MQDYISLRVDASPCTEDITDLLAAYLCDIGYESFTSDASGLYAYIKEDLYSRENLENALSDFPIPAELSFTTSVVKGEDWNEEWEKNYFKPIIVDGRCVIHSSFHKDIPSAEYDIVVDPKMAFGTGHHSTTFNMMRHILSMDLRGKKVIDMGTGTGILAILCKMKGAEIATGIEIDPYAWENAVENARLNGVDVNMVCGDATVLSGESQCDVFMANINRNIITADMASYAASLKKGGTMLLSGFYVSDISIVEEKAAQYGLAIEDVKEDNEWVALRLVKAP